MCLGYVVFCPCDPAIQQDLYVFRLHSVECVHVTQPYKRLQMCLGYVVQNVSM